MSTKALLYPFGFYLASVLPPVDDQHPVITSLDQAMDNYWKYCTLSAVVTVRVNDFPTIGTHTDIADTLSGQRLDFGGSVIIQTDPRSLIGATKNYTNPDEFASPHDFPSSFVPGQPFGGDNTYQGQYTFRGLMPFTRTHALPVIQGEFLVTCNNGAVFKFDFQEPVTNPNRRGVSITVAGFVIPAWLSWTGAAVPSTAQPDGSIVVSVLTNFIWP